MARGLVKLVPLIPGAIGQTLDLESWPPIGSKVLPGLERGASGECDCRDTTQGDRDPQDPLLHGKSSGYQGFKVFDGDTLVLLAVFVLPFRSTKTDQTLGRSVALLAQSHPKCPFQVERRRVRALKFGL
jgi:hypothetical protein